tara:strand:+ start:1207 stop:1368 length:162 start_codon:yes stop_codon:yes gene_type:complete
MASTLTKRLLQIVIENSRLRQYARRLEARIEFLEKHCDCPRRRGASTHGDLQQ